MAPLTHHRRPTWRPYPCTIVGIAVTVFATIVLKPERGYHRGRMKPLTIQIPWLSFNKLIFQGLGPTSSSLWQMPRPTCIVIYSAGIDLPSELRPLQRRKRFHRNYIRFLDNSIFHITFLVYSSLLLSKQRFIYHPRYPLTNSTVDFNHL